MSAGPAGDGETSGAETAPAKTGSLAPVQSLPWDRIPLDEHSGDFVRLCRLLARTGHFQLILAQFNSPACRDALIDALAPDSGTEGAQQAVWTLPDEPDLPGFRSALAERAAGVSALHLVGLDGWLDKSAPAVLRDLNYSREAIAAAARLPLVLWLAAEQIRPLAEGAPDLWAWRGAVLDFAIRPREALPIERASLLGPLRTDGETARRRLAEIDAFLQDAAPGVASARLLLEGAHLSKGIGDWDRAMGYAGESMRQSRELDNARGTALALGRIADILEARGQLDEALRIRTDEELPVYERLGDVRSAAVTRGKIADILEARGQLDAALRIRTDEELPVYERLRDVRGLLVCRAKIAMTLLARATEHSAPEDLTRANALLCQALADARRLRIPEASQIELILRSAGIDCPEADADAAALTADPDRSQPVPAGRSDP